MGQHTDVIRRLYPFESRYVTIGGQRMHYVDEGQGSPIVLLHGNPTWSFFYRELITQLRDEYRVIAPDHIGFGLSEKPQRYRYTLQRHIDNLEKLLQSLHILEPLTLGMHDWGGPIGFGYALRQPQHVGRFILFNTTAFLGEVPLRIRACRFPLAGKILVRSFNAAVRGVLACGLTNRERLTADTRAGYMMPYRSYRDRVAIEAFIREIPVRPRHRNYEFIRELDLTLPQFRNRPSIILWGAADFCFTRAFFEGWLERFPGAEAHLLEEAGHLVVEDAPERIGLLLRDFLHRTQSRMATEAATGVA